uniref:Uncharacterized protein n=1 Tax=Glossina palpalis gambiensis TaxID=67801 RepID=A0A1B0B3F4_9MUSC
MVLLYSLKIIIASFLIAKANSALYRFVPEYGEVYQDCDYNPEMGGYSDFVDVSETNVIADDEGIHFNGTITILWDVKETDRVTVRYRHEPFSVLVEIDALVNMEGRYKGVTILRAYDENNQLKPNVICLETPGDIVKVKRRN